MDMNLSSEKTDGYKDAFISAGLSVNKLFVLYEGY